MIVLVLLSLAVSPISVLWWRRHQALGRARLRRAQLPDALERMAGALRTGSSLRQALVETARETPPPLGPELAALELESRHGRAIVDVLDDWAAARADRGTRLAATALMLATRVGAAPARAVDGVAATLRERLQLADERRAFATQARTSALVLSLAPVVFLLLFGITDTASSRFLLGTPTGWLCLVVGIGLDLVGVWWMSRLVTKTGVEL